MVVSYDHLMWLSYQRASQPFYLPSIAPFPSSELDLLSSPKKVCISWICTTHVLSPTISNQSIYPPSLRFSLYSYLPAVWKLFNRPSTPTLVPVLSFSIHPQDSSAPLKKKIYLKPLPPSWQPNILTPPNPPYRMAEEVSANLELSIAQRWLTSNNRCGKCAPRWHSVSFYPPQISVSIVRACEHLFWALRPASPPPLFRLRPAPQVPSHDDIILTYLGHYQLRWWRNNSSRANRRPRRWRILLWRACGWPWRIHSSYWWSGVARRSRKYWWHLEGCIWSKRTAWYRCCAPICSQALGGHVSHRGELFSLFIFLPSPTSMNLISFPANPLYLLSQRQASPSKSQQMYWPKQQRGGTGNVHKEPAPTVHKGLADVLKHKIGLGKKKTSGSWISI